MKNNMNKFLFLASFSVGAIAILWIGGVFLGHDPLGLVVTLIIAFVYLIGTFELLRFRRATSTLTLALGSLTEPLEHLEPWLKTIDAQLRDAVRIRAMGGRNPLPGPILTPYLVGLLVMLGLLGTFIGMVDTLRGAVTALQGTTELEAIRQGLAAPIEGLGLAFGTSVAGVAASAMLGLSSALSRRERIHSSRLLDQKVAEELSLHSPTHQQILAFKAIQNQSEALPKVAEQLEILAVQLSNLGQSVGEKLSLQHSQLSERLLEAQAETSSAITETVGKSLSTTTEGISESLVSAATDVFKQLELQALDSNLRAVRVIDEKTKIHQEQLDSLISVTGAHVENLLEEMKGNVADLSKRLLESSEVWANKQVEQSREISLAIREEMKAWRDQEQDKVQSAFEKLASLDELVAEHLTTMGLKLEEPITRLIEVASESPKAAAEVITKLRDEVAKNVERENVVLAERADLMTSLNEISDKLAANSIEQKATIEALVSQSTETFSSVGDKFNEQVSKESKKISDSADLFAASTADMASWGEAFQVAMEQFSDSTSILIENLNRIESALADNNARSDEQLAYYVAQAREIIDHNLLSHQQIISALNAQKSQPSQRPQQMAVEGVSK